MLYAIIYTYNIKSKKKEVIKIFKKNKEINSIIYGLAVGDALGVPVEFKTRNTIAKNPIVDMVGRGTHNQPKGTWSDDTSMTLCTLDSLSRGYSLEDLLKTYNDWFTMGYLTPFGTVFDVGNATSLALMNFQRGKNPYESGLTQERYNGNGSLMRISPMYLYIKNKGIENLEEIKELVERVSGLTHNHDISKIACVYYILFMLNVKKSKTLNEALDETNKQVTTLYQNNEFLMRFDRILTASIINEQVENIESSGYVLHSLEASLWCLFNTSNYKEAVLKAVNLGDDTDTTGAITGALAGLYYGESEIPKEWISSLQNKGKIKKIINRFNKAHK